MSEETLREYARAEKRVREYAKELIDSLPSFELLKVLDYISCIKRKMTRFDTNTPNDETMEAME